MTKIRWGLLGPGNISTTFAKGLQSLPDAEIFAVGSRDLGRAQTFASEFGAPRVYGSYAELVADPQVDVIYIGTPHSYHHPHTLLALNASKHVLCEKPFALNADQAREMAALARQKNLFLMEAMWSRFLPTMVRLRELVAEGAIGEVRMIQGDFGFRTNFNPEGRLFDPALGGGALLDVGVYPISLATMLLGEPERVKALATRAETGVDEQSAVLLGFPSGALALASSAVRTNTPHEAIVNGSDGWIHITKPFWRGTQLRVQRAGETEQILDLPYEGNGYNYQAQAVHDAIRAGQIESPVMSLDESVMVMETLDRIQAAF